MKEIQFDVAKAITVSNNFSVPHVKEGKLEDLLLICIHWNYSTGPCIVGSFTHIWISQIWSDFEHWHAPQG
jgi:hypothetical protein